MSLNSNKRKYTDTLSDEYDANKLEGIDDVTNYIPVTNSSLESRRNDYEEKTLKEKQKIRKIELKQIDDSMPPLTEEEKKEIEEIHKQRLEYLQEEALKKAEALKKSEALKRQQQEGTCSIMGGKKSCPNKRKTSCKKRKSVKKQKLIRKKTNKKRKLSKT
jgi:hypothetical protein